MVNILKVRIYRLSGGSAETLGGDSEVKKMSNCRIFYVLRYFSVNNVCLYGKRKIFFYEKNILSSGHSCIFYFIENKNTFINGYFNHQ